jgi:hypothetical protein
MSRFIVPISGNMLLFLLVVQQFILRQDPAVWLGDLESDMDFFPGQLFHVDEVID